MKQTLLFISAALLLLTQGMMAADLSSEAKKSWGQWRGPLATGVAPQGEPPLTWNETNGIKWQVKIPGQGDSTPVVWGDKVFILTAVPSGKKADAAATEPSGDRGNRKGGGGEKPTETYQFVTLCLDRKTGRTLWQKVAREELPHEGHQANNTFASASPITDGEYVLSFFGSRGLHCYDLDGNLKWSKDFGRMATRMGFGEGASPALYGNTVVVYWDDEGDDDFITALDKRTGKELWRTPRSEATGWSTPLIVDYEGKPQVIVNASGKVRSYDLATGKEIWSCGGQTANAIPSPVASSDTVFVTSGFRGSALFAIALGHTGDLAGTDAIRWTRSKYTPYVPSPLLVDGKIYVIANNSAMLSCFDAKTGTPQYEGERLEGISEIYASPVAAADKIYVLGRDGTCLVLKHGAKLEILATNKLGDKTDASPSIVGSDIFIRGRKALYCIGK